MRNWKLAAAVTLFGLIGAGCADGFNLTGGRVIDDGAPAPAPVTVPAATEQGNNGNGNDASQVIFPEPSGGGETTDPTAPPVTEPPVTEPPVTEPPATDPPATEPPATTVPPTTEPPTTTVPPTTEPPTTEPPTTTVPPTTEPPIRQATIKVMLIRFQAIKDCDGIEGVGEFNFNAFVATADGTVQGSTGGYRELTDGAYWNHLKEVTFTLPETEGSGFDVVFTSTEVDKDIFQNVYNDSRMDSLRGSGSHRFSGGVWTSSPVVSTGLGGTYPNAVQVINGSGNCSAELHYVVTID